MNEQRPSKEHVCYECCCIPCRCEERRSLPALKAWLRERHVERIASGDEWSYEELIHAHIERMEAALRGVSTCSTCEACRGAATLVLDKSQGGITSYTVELTEQQRRGLTVGIDEIPLPAETRAATSRRAHGTEDAGRPGPYTIATAEPEPTHFAFLIKRPRDKEAWPTIFDDRERAIAYEHRASEVVPVHLALPPPDVRDEDC